MKTRSSIQTKKARSGPPSVKRFSSQIVSRLAERTEFADPALAERWPEIVGAEIAALCRPGRITGGGRGGRVLELHTQNGAAAATVEFHKHAIRQNVNAFLGPEVLRSVLVRQTGPALKEKPPKSTKSPHLSRNPDQTGGPASPELQTALSRFRSSISVKNSGK